MLFATAANLATDVHRRERRWAKRFVPADDAVGSVASDRPGPDATAHAQARVERLAAALDGLPRRCRDAFLMNRLDGLSHREIAARLGVSSKTVQRHIERALCHCVAVVGDEAEVERGP